MTAAAVPLELLLMAQCRRPANSTAHSEPAGIEVASPDPVAVPGGVEQAADSDLSLEAQESSPELSSVVAPA